MKNSNIGGQAVIEGIMMRNKDDYAIAVRLNNGKIEVKKDRYKGVVKNKFLTQTPFVRGFFNFIDSMVLGYSTLTWSANKFAEEDETDNDSNNALSNFLMVISVVIAIAFSIGLFVILPFFVSSVFFGSIKSRFLVSLLEGLLRLGIFILYIVLISLMKDIKRVYRYHGAEHKCINCIENGMKLTVSNVRKSSKQHKRCGTSFLLFVIIFSIIIGLIIRVDTLWLKVVIRIAIIPVIAGISYEFIKFAGRTNLRLINILSKPGLWLQNLTVKEPDDDMIKVAIKAVEAVFDWKEFLKDYDK